MSMYQRKHQPKDPGVRIGVRQVSKPPRKKNLNRKILSLSQLVAELSWDEPFGMLTRNAFLQFCRRLPPAARRIAFIDLNDVGEMNLLYGYTEVDRRIQRVFAIFHGSGDIVARWYSGDEIVILFAGESDPIQKLNSLRLAAQTEQLTFFEQSGVWDSALGPVECAVLALSNQIGLQKLFARQLQISGGRYDESRKYSTGCADRDVDPGGVF